MLSSLTILIITFVNIVVIKIEIRICLVCFILRACGLAAEVPKLDFSDISGSLSTIMDLANERKVGFENERIPLVNKDKANERYTQKIREFMGILLRDDY